jgi:hypothetical protein
MKHCLYYLGILSLIISGLEASASQGKAVYTTSCLPCHISAKGMASQKLAKTWKELLLFDKDTSNTLAKIHLDSNKAKASWDYFRSEAYRQENRHLKDFLQKYSSDRGRHNSCY